ncbi:unnamed protein product [Gordionus sp. m RMFG-2023]
MKHLTAKLLNRNYIIDQTDSTLPLNENDKSKRLIETCKVPNLSGTSNTAINNSLKSEYAARTSEINDNKSIYNDDNTTSPIQKSIIDPEATIRFRNKNCKTDSDDCFLVNAIPLFKFAEKDESSDSGLYDMSYRKLIMPNDHEAIGVGEMEKKHNESKSLTSYNSEEESSYSGITSNSFILPYNKQKHPRSSYKDNGTDYIKVNQIEAIIENPASRSPPFIPNSTRIYESLYCKRLPLNINRGYVPSNTPSDVYEDITEVRSSYDNPCYDFYIPCKSREEIEANIEMDDEIESITLCDPKNIMKKLKILDRNVSEGIYDTSLPNQLSGKDLKFGAEKMGPKSYQGNSTIYETISSQNSLTNTIDSNELRHPRYKYRRTSASPFTIERDLLNKKFQTRYTQNIKKNMAFPAARDVTNNRISSKYLKSQMCEKTSNYKYWANSFHNLSPLYDENPLLMDSADKSKALLCYYDNHQRSMINISNATNSNLYHSKHYSYSSSMIEKLGAFKNVKNLSPLYDYNGDEVLKPLKTGHNSYLLPNGYENRKAFYLSNWSLLRPPKQQFTVRFDDSRFNTDGRLHKYYYPIEIPYDNDHNYGNSIIKGLKKRANKLFQMFNKSKSFKAV